jgi:flagellin-specific chaperone FliS
MKKLDKSDKKHLLYISNKMMQDLSKASLFINENSGEYDTKQLERAIDEIAVFVGTFPYYYALDDYTSIVRVMIEALYEYENPQLDEEN